VLCSTAVERLRTDAATGAQHHLRRGYADSFDVALPILQRHGFAATFFVPPAFRRRRMFNDSIIEAVRQAPARPSICSGRIGLLPIERPPAPYAINRIIEGSLSPARSATTRLPPSPRNPALRFRPTS
jgi:hypothetical protein